MKTTNKKPNEKLYIFSIWNGYVNFLVTKSIVATNLQDAIDALYSIISATPELKILYDENGPIHTEQKA